MNLVYKNAKRFLVWPGKNLDDVTEDAAQLINDLNKMIKIIRPIKSLKSFMRQIYCCKALSVDHYGKVNKAPLGKYSPC